MKKLIKNVVIVMIVISGIISVWFMKNREFNIENEVMQDDVGILDVSTEDNTNVEEKEAEEIKEDIQAGVIINNINKVDEDIESVIEENEETNKEDEIKEDEIKEDEIKEDEIKEDEIKEDIILIDKNDLNFELSTPSFDVENLKSYGLPILLDFGAKWCGPCQKMHPILEELNNELRGKAIIKYIDIDDYPEATNGYKFNLIPTQYFITKEGEIYKTHTGVLSKNGVIKILKEMGMEE